MSKFSVTNCTLGFQHLLAMFGSTVLVPLITGMSPSMALFCAGIGTLIFHLCTKCKVPVFLGSSFAFIPALCTVIGGDAANIPLAQGGIIAAGLVYVVFALIVQIVGVETIKKIFPPIVTGPAIVIIGLSLTGVGIADAIGKNDGLNPGHMLQCSSIAIFTFVVMVICMSMKWKTPRLIPILIGMAAGYLLCVILNVMGVYNMNFEPITQADWLNVPYQNGFMSVPKFTLQAAVIIAPIALVTFLEHLGDITTIGAVVGKDYFKDPGLHRTLMGDGLATAVAGFFGGPPNTTYSENTGVLASTGNYNPVLLRFAAYLAILLAFFGKFGAVLQTIPVPVKGGIEIVLFGMIASVGVRTISEAKIDMTNVRNLTIMGAMLCTGIGFGSIGGLPLVIGGVNVNVSGLFIATVVGVLLNLVMPKDLRVDINTGDNK